MGVIGGAIGRETGGIIGATVGQIFGGKKGAQALGNIGRVAGDVGGKALMPFKKGGKVPGKKGAPKVIMAHGGEYVLPVGVKPTKAQKAQVAKRKAKK
jgi:hypothetical protein